MKFHENWSPRDEELVAPLSCIVQLFLGWVFLGTLVLAHGQWLLFCVRAGPNTIKAREFRFHKDDMSHQTGFTLCPVQEMVETIELAGKCALESKEREPKVHACLRNVNAWLAKRKCMLAHIRPIPSLWSNRSCVSEIRACREQTYMLAKQPATKTCAMPYFC